MEQNKNTVKITSIKTYNSNADIFGKDKYNNQYYIFVPFNESILRAKRNGLVQFRKAIIKQLRSQNENIRFICPKHLI